MLKGEMINITGTRMKCIFPFQFRGKIYSNCTNDYACPDCFWCGTQFNVSYQTGWGVCDEKCPIEYGKNVFIYISLFFSYTPQNKK